MTRSWITLALGALILLPAAAGAQDHDVTVYTVRSRPRIGVLVDSDAPAADRKLGATIKAVIPGGPAAKAGLEAGDILTRFNGTALGGDEPWEKLVELARALSPGDSVTVEYRRGASQRNAMVVAADLGGAEWSLGWGPGEGRVVELERMMRDHDLPMADMERSMAGMGDRFEFRFGGGGPGLELAEMNAGLGEYFGTATGVLVLDNPADSTLPLKAGDVILAIDGRTPASVGQARRILGSYDSGDVAKFEIMRMKKKAAVSWTVPGGMRMKMPGAMQWRTPMPPGTPDAPGSTGRMRVKVAPADRSSASGA
jgi:membrane-associated protease RseP (regulator of RpoE activity)